ncbi:MAG: glycogen debranching protein [Clostridia bacterium]|nr:glycogen debranching protein [Clostridia bacterium]
MSKLSVKTNATFPKSICASEHAKLIGTTDGLFPDFGHHSEREMGGLWMHPIKVLDGFWLRFFDQDADNVNTWIIADRYEIAPWGDRFEYMSNLGHTSVKIVREQIAPDDAKGLVVTYRFANRSDRPRRVQAEFLARTELYPVWFTLDAKAREDGKDVGAWDENTLTFRAKDEKNPWHAAIRCGERPDRVQTGELFGPQKTSGQGTSVSMSYDKTIGGYGEWALTFYLTGSAVSESDAEDNLAALTGGKDFESEKKARFAEMTAQSALRVGDERFETIFDWVKVHCDWLTVNAGEYGRAIAAGLPEYPWWFGCDSCYTIQGLLCAGQYDLARQTLALLADYSARVNDGNGRIVHEITPYGLCPNPGNTQETAHFVTAVWHYWRWTGDEAFVLSLLPLLRKSMQWLDAMDADGDGFPSGYGIIEIAGLSAEMIDTAVYTAQAWGCFADFLALAGDVPGEEQAREKHAFCVNAVNTILWDEEAGLYCDACASPEFVRSCRENILFRRGDSRNEAAGAAFDAMVEKKAALGSGETGFIINKNWIQNTPMEAGIAPEDKAAAALSNMHTPDYIGPWGMYLNVLRQDQTMTISTGAMAVAQARYGYADRALELLDRMCATFGMVGPGQFAEMSPDYGCVVQAWTAYALFTPVVRHMLGIQPDAAKGEVVIRPCLPQRWRDVTLSRVRVLDGEITVHIRREGEKTCVNVSGTPGLRVRIIYEENESVQTLA